MIEPEAFLPFLIFSIPIIAIVGGIVAGIVRTLGRQRLIEMAQRERITAIERGIDPANLPPLPLFDNGEQAFGSREDMDHRRSQSLMIAGIITTAVGVGLIVFLLIIGPDHSDRGVWAVGIIPSSVGVALLLSAWLVRPKGGRGA
jgi:hypothetical protein